MRRSGWFCALALIMCGCFMGYDSRWGEQKRAQQNFARDQTPKAVHAGEGGNATSDQAVEKAKKLRVRVYASRAYAAQVLDWQRRFDETLADVNRVFAPTFGVKLEVVDARFWQPNASEESIDALLAELREFDDGTDVDWVVGLIGAVPRFAQSFHELGVGTVLGEHLVVRSINNVQEHEAFEAGLTELGHDERERLIRARLAHKVMAVLLHELGHTLGAIHEQDRASLMNPSYSHQREGFSPETIEVMQLALQHRMENGGLDADGARSMAALFKRSAGAWVPSERETAIARLERAAVPQPSSASPPPTEAPLPPAEVSALSEPDRKRFEDAQRLRQAGDLDGAHRRALPLFDTYPKVEAIQDFRCQLAMQKGGAWKQTRSECEGLLKLGPNRARK